MTATHCIILCGGRNSRWKGFRGTHRKHLVKVEGEILLSRTLRLVAAYEPARTVVVVNEDDLDLYKAYLSDNTEFYGIKENVPYQTDAYKFLSSKELWNPIGRTIVLLGDVWFSENAIKTIFKNPADDWTAFGRNGASKFTGHPYGELFAQCFTDYREHELTLDKLDEMYRTGTCKRAASGWAHYQLMIGKDPNIHTVGPRFVEIDDFTDDFDTPEDYDAWVAGRTSTKPVVRSSPKIGRNDPCPCGSGKKFKKCCVQ